MGSQHNQDIYGNPLAVRVPPQSVESEQALIGAALISRKAVPELLARDREEFYHEGHRRIYDAIRELARRQQPVDVLSVPEELKRRGQLDAVGGLAYINTLADSVPTAAHANYYARTVQEKAAYRGLIEEGNDLIERCYAQEISPEELVQQLVRNVLARTQAQSQGAVRDLRDVVPDEVQRIYRKERPPVLYTGIAPLDRMAGGLLRKEVALICSRPGGGKSVAGLQFGTYAATHWGPTLIISLEMDADSIARRALASGTGFTYREIRDAGRYDEATGAASEFSEFDYERISRTAEAWAALPHPLLVDEHSHRLERLIQRVHQLRLDPGIECVIVDYGQLVRADGKSRVEQVGAVAQAVKQEIAVPLDVPVYVMVQANRGVEGRTGGRKKDGQAPDWTAQLLQKSDLGWSSDWEAFAQQIHFINRDPRIPEPTGDQKEPIMPVLWGVDKNRNDGVGRVPLVLDRPRFQFEERNDRYAGMEPPEERGNWQDYADEE